MTANVTTPAPATPKRVGLSPRILAFLALSGVVAGVAHLAHDAYSALTDAWMAPLELSPDADMVVQLNVKLNEQLVTRAKFKADIDRSAIDIVGVDDAIGRLELLRKQGHEALRWAAQSTGQSATSTTASVRSLETQHTLLAEMLKRQNSLVDTTKQNVDAGLAASSDYDRELQVQNQLRVAVEENERQQSDLRTQGTQLTLAASALRDVTEGRSLTPKIGMLPDVVEGKERDVHVELELVKLQAERRALVEEQAIAKEGIERMDALLKQMKSRPLYRAIEARTDIAFIPYTQLDGVKVGSDLMACTWAVFACHKVGHVKEVVAGEVVAQDPWSEIARGQYAVLELDDHEAMKEKVLRARPAKR